MAVLQFGFTPSERHTQHVPAHHEEDQVVYTGTHDNDTIRGWYDGLPPASLALVEESLREYGIVEDEPEWAMIRLAFASPARLAMIQLQDVLGLGNEGRMNQPGTAGGWGWKLDELPSMDLARGCGPRRRGGRGAQFRRAESGGFGTAATEGEGSGVCARAARTSPPGSAWQDGLACRSPSSYGPLTVRGAPRSSVGLLRISRKRTRAGEGARNRCRPRRTHLFLTPFVRSAVVIEHDRPDVERREATTTAPRDFRCP